MVNTLTSIEIVSATAASGGTVNCVLNYVYLLDGAAKTVTSSTYPTNKAALDALLLGKTVLIMYNDIGVSGVNSVQGSISFSPFDADADLLFTKQLSLSAGKKYAFYASLSDGTAYSNVSNPLKTVTVIDTPQKAIMAVTPLDQALSVKIAYPLANSIYDGYSPITSVQITVTGVFVALDPAISKVYHFIIGGDYTTDMQIPNLLNGNAYEVISTFFSAAGPSPISSSVSAVPSDTPDLITNTGGEFDKVFAMSKIEYDTVKNVSTNKGIVVYSTWPTDKKTLESTGLKITKVKVILTTLKYAINSWSADDTVPVVEKEYLLPSTSTGSGTSLTYTYTSADGIYNAAGFDDYISSNIVPFRFIISDVAVGTAVKANVVFGNDNGYPGQNGSFTQNVMSMLCPEQPTLLGNVIPSAASCAFDIYRTVLPSTNGGKANKYKMTGSIVDILGASSGMTETSTVEFTSNSFTTNLVPVTTVNVFKYNVPDPTIGSTYNYNFETITEDPFNASKLYYSNLASISLISKQNISSYKQIQVRSWNDDGTPVLIGGAPGIYFNFKAESLTAVAFHGGVNGSSITANDVSIRLAKNSQLIPLNEVPAKQHPGTAIATALTYNIPQAVSSLDQYYIRVVVIDRQYTSINLATGLPNAAIINTLTSVDSSPSLSMASESYLPPVQSLTIVRDLTDATKATLKYTKPNDASTFNICGFNPSIDTGTPDTTAGTIKILTRRAHNAIIVIDDSTGVKAVGVTVQMPIVPSITTSVKITSIIPWNYVKSGNNVELALTGLEGGKSYTVYALSGMYTIQAGYLRTGTVSPPNDFQGFIRKNYTSYSFVAAAPSSPPAPYNVYGKNAGLYGEWTAPPTFAGASLKQYDISAFNYGDGVADIADVTTPLFTAPTQNPVYSTTNNYALINSVWPSRAAGNLGTGSKIPLVNGDVILTGIRTITEILVKNLINSSFSVTSSGLIMGVNDNIPSVSSGSISYTSTSMNTLSTVIDPTTLIGAYTINPEKAEPNVEPAAPQQVSAASSNNLITVSFLKATDGLSDEVRIITDGVEEIFTKRFKGNYLGVNFTSAFAASGATSGLLFIQAVFSNPGTYPDITYTGVLSKIQSIFGGVVNGNFVFKISGVNGQTKTIGVMYVDVSTFSQEDTLSAITPITAAASAPPSIVIKPTFTVSNNLLSLAWEVPSNIGGAGISVGTGKANNSDLKYRIDVFMNQYDKSNNIASVLYSMKDISALSQTIAVPNNTTPTYYANIVAYYYNEGIITSPSIDISNTAWFNSVDSTSSLALPIRVGPTPLQGSTSALALATQSISFTYTLPALLASYAYPINLLAVYVDDAFTKYYTYNSSSVIVAGDGSNLAIAKTAAVTAAGTFAPGAVVPITLGSVNGLLNGGKYKVSVKPMGIYTYAQMPLPTEQFNLTPYASIQIDAASAQSTDNKKITTVVNMNGDELKSAIIIGRDASRVNHVLPILTGNAFYTKSGTVTSTAVANQTATFTSTFPTAMEGVLIIVNGQNTSDIDDIPTGSFGATIPTP